MKKGISISLLALTLAACGGGSSSGGGDPVKAADKTEPTTPSEITIASYSSDSASSDSPVGTWIAVYSGTHFTDNVQDRTYKGRELFTITERNDEYIINSCDDFIDTPSIKKTDFLKAKTVDESGSNSTEKYTQTFTSNTNFTRSSTSTETVSGEGNEKDSIEKWVQTTAAIKINDSVNINEKINITSQNDVLATDNIEISCAGLKENSKGLSIFSTENDQVSIVLENDSIKKEHFIYFDKRSSGSNLSFENSATKSDIDISYDVTNDTAENYSVTANLNSPTHSGTFNVSVDFK